MMMVLVVVVMVAVIPDFEGCHNLRYGLHRWKIGYWTMTTGLVQAKLSQKSSVSKGYSPRPIYSNDILVVLSYFNNNTSPIPFQFILTNLVLDPHMISYS